MLLYYGAVGPVLRAGFETSQKIQYLQRRRSDEVSKAAKGLHRTHAPSPWIPLVIRSGPFLPSLKGLVPAIRCGRRGPGRKATIQIAIEGKSKMQTHESNKMKRQRTSIDCLLGHVAGAAHDGPTLHLPTELTAWREKPDETAIPQTHTVLQ